MRKLVLALCLCACTPDFESASQVRDLRVLAVRLDPPEALFDQGSVDPVSVHLLVVDPAHPAALAEVRAQVCFPTDSLRCDQGTRIELGRVGTDFTLPAPSQALLQAAANDDRLKGLGGIRVQLSLSVDTGDAHGPAAAEKTAIYARRDHPANQNPSLTGVRLSRKGVDAGMLAPGDTLVLAAGDELGLRPLLTPGAREQYQAIDLTGKPLQLTEELRYSFFASGTADLDRDAADEPLAGIAPPDGLVRVRALRPGSGTLWIVVRDERGGESWSSFPWSSP